MCQEPETLKKKCLGASCAERGNRGISPKILYLTTKRVLRRTSGGGPRDRGT